MSVPSPESLVLENLERLSWAIDQLLMELPDCLPTNAPPGATLHYSEIVDKIDELLVAIYVCITDPLARDEAIKAAKDKKEGHRNRLATLNNNLLGKTILFIVIDLTGQLGRLSKICKQTRRYITQEIDPTVFSERYIVRRVTDCVVDTISLCHLLVEQAKHDFDELNKEALRRAGNIQKNKN